VQSGRLNFTPDLSEAAIEREGMMLLRRGCIDPQVRAVQEILKSLGFVARTASGAIKNIAVDGDFGDETENAVMNFQKSSGLLVDGVVGPVTMKELQEAYTRKMVELHAPTATAATPIPERMQLLRVDADPWAAGYTGLYLRCDAAVAYSEVRKQVLALGGLLTTSGGIRELTQSGGPNRSMVSFHYLGLALDLFIYSGMIDPAHDPYVVAFDENDTQNRSFRVWARCSTSKVKPRKITRVVTYGQRDGSLPDIEGPFVDLTALFLDQGFSRIPPRPAFFAGTSDMAAEWWHFQFEKPLFPHASTFGSELLKVYSRSQLEGTDPWAQRDRVFKVDWS
jgi:hypothetical protein